MCFSSSPCGRKEGREGRRRSVGGQFFGGPPLTSQGGGSRRGNIYIKEEGTSARPKAPFFSNKILFPSCRCCNGGKRGRVLLLTRLLLLLLRRHSVLNTLCVRATRTEEVVINLCSTRKGGEVGEGVSLCRVVSEEKEYAVLFAHAASKRASALWPRPVPHTDCSSHKNSKKEPYFALFARHVFKSVSLRTQLVLS